MILLLLKQVDSVEGEFLKCVEDLYLLVENGMVCTKGDFEGGGLAVWILCLVKNCT